MASWIVSSVLRFLLLLPNIVKLGDDKRLAEEARTRQQLRDENQRQHSDEQTDYTQRKGQRDKQDKKKINMIIDTQKRAEALSTQDPGEGTSAKYWQHKRLAEDRRLADEDRNRQRDEIQRCHAKQQTEYSGKKELIDSATKRTLRTL